MNADQMFDCVMAVLGVVALSVAALIFVEVWKSALELRRERRRGKDEK